MIKDNKKAGGTIAPAYLRKNDAKIIKRQIECEIFESELDPYKANIKASQSKVLLKAGKAMTAGVTELSDGSQYYSIARGATSVKITSKAKQVAMNTAQKMPEKFMIQAKAARIEDLKNEFYSLSSRQKKKLGFKTLQDYIKANL